MTNETSGNPKRSVHRYLLLSGDSVVSHYLLDGPGGKRGEPAAYYAWETDLAGLALANELRVSVRAVRLPENSMNPNLATVPSSGGAEDGQENDLTSMEIIRAAQAAGALSFWDDPQT